MTSIKSTDERSYISEKIFELIPRIAHVFHGIENFLPFSLAENHPHILVKLNALWPSNEVLVYLNELMVPIRLDRKGFNPVAISEVLFLRDLYQLIYPLPDSRISEFIANPVHYVTQPSTIEELIGIKNRVENNIAYNVEQLSNTSVGFDHELSNWGELGTLDEIRDFWVRKHDRQQRPTPLIGEILAEHKVVSSEAIDVALELQALQQPRPKIGHILADKKLCSKFDIHKALALQSRFALINLDLISPTEEATLALNSDLWRRLNAVPVLTIGKVLFVAVENPLVYSERYFLVFSTNMTIELVFAHKKSIDRKIDEIARREQLL